MPTKPSAKAPAALSRALDALPDPADFRDQLFAPTLIEVPPRLPVERYLAAKVPVLDQKREGACVGFALATVAHFLLRGRGVDPDRAKVSPRMFYEMAKRYDEWPGEDYAGTSARGGMKGWHKHGVCSERIWPYLVGSPRVDCDLSDARVRDALQRPLGAYYRVNHRDVVALHSAITEVGVLLATARAHSGWKRPRKDGRIVPSGEELAGHAFAIVGYDEAGFWIQNSWGASWGRGGLGLLTYDDWLERGMDAWVARLGAPVKLHTARSTSVALSASASRATAFTFADVRPHVVSVGNDGAFRTKGTYGTSADDVARIFAALPATFAEWGDAKHRLLLYAHGGLVDEQGAVQVVANYRQPLLDAHVYPLAFIWRTDYLTTLRNILEDAARRRRPEGAIEAAKNFLFDRLDDMLEPLARGLTGKAEWDEIKENARLASESATGAARFVAEQVRTLAAASGVALELHLVAHSAGSIFLGPMIDVLTQPVPGIVAPPVRVETTTVWAPACTIDLFDKAYAPALESGRLKKLAVYLLTENAERDDDCANVYHKSLLYLVSNAFEEKQHIPLIRNGFPLLGMQRFADDTLVAARLRALVAAGKVELVLAPNSEPESGTRCSRAQHHSAFDDDRATVTSTFRRIVGTAGVAPVGIPMSQESLDRRRRHLERPAIATQRS
jgi:hypothetical protein